MGRVLPKPVLVPEPAPSASEGTETLVQAQRFIREIIAVSTLPAIWMGADSLRIADSLLTVLETTIRPVFSYIWIPPLVEGGKLGIELAFIDGRQAEPEQTMALGARLREWSQNHDPDEILNASLLSDDQPLRCCAYRLGYDHGAGVLAAGFAASEEASGSPTELQRTLLNIAANQAVTAFRNVTLQLQAEAARAETQALYEVSRALAAELDLQTILQTTTDAVTKLSGAKFGAFFHNVVDEKGQSYNLYTLSGARREDFSKFGMPRNTPIFDHTFQGKGPVRLDDVQKDPRYGQMPPHHGLPKGHLPVRSYLAVPVLSRTGETYGGIFLAHPEPGVFTERSERIAMGIAGQAAVALENARLFAKASSELAQRRQMEELLREGERRKDEFLATLSHELRNPLAPICTAVGILKLAKRDPSRVATAVAVIERQSSHLLRLVDDLLDVSRITRGKIELRKQKVELASVIEQAIESVRPLSDSRQLRLSVRTAVHPIFLEMDAVRVVQILGNLLNNACKYNRERGEIHIQTSQQGDEALISVRDNGIGIEREQLTRIFEMFAQVEDSKTRAPGGLGIGLSLAKSLTEMHGGTIEARSEGLGKGSEFILRLPALPGAASAQRSENALAGTDAEGKGALRIVAVDDYKDALESIATLLEVLGHEVDTASNGEEALRVVDAQRHDVVLLDIGLPRLDGYEVARRIRRLPGGDALLLVAMTGWGQEQDKLRATEAGFDFHLTKPADPERLKRLLDDRALAKASASIGAAPASLA